MPFRTLLFAIPTLLIGTLLMDGLNVMTSVAWGQEDEPPLKVEAANADVQEGENAKQDDQDPEKSEAKPEDDEPMVELSSGEVAEIGPREIQLRLWDGSVLTGDIGVTAIHIKTKFGMLEVPVANIVNLRPGLNSLPEVREEVDGLIAALGDREFQTREQAKQKLLNRGVAFLDYLKGIEPPGNVEQKKNLQLVIDSLNEQIEDELDSDRSSRLSLEDAITTSTFTIVGEIQEKDYELATRYGLLRIALKDIQAGNRSFHLAGETIQKRVEVDALAFFQRTPKSTRIRVNAGDRISIRATGTVQWASWGDTTSTPDGLSNQGMWNGIPSGALVARIGKSDDYVKIGTKMDFVAKTSGELILGVAMQDNFARQNGYQWNGSYTATVRVESGRK